MASIPDFTAVGQAQPQPAGGVASQSASGLIGDAAAGLGETVAKLGEDQTKHDDALAASAARAEYYRRAIDLDAAVRNTPDYGSWKGMLATGLDNARNELSAKLVGPDARDQFNIDTLNDGLRLTGAISEAANARSIDTRRAGVLQLLEDGRQDYARATDPSIRMGIVNNMNGAITSAVGGGLYSATEAVGLRQKTMQDIARDYAASLPPGDALKLLGSSIPNRSGMLGPARGADVVDLIPSLERSGATAVSPKGAAGTYQITPDTAKAYGLDYAKLSDPSPAGQAYARAGAQQILDDLSGKFGGDRTLMFAAYNAGAGMVADWMNGTNKTGKNSRLVKLGNPATGETTDAAFAAAIPFKETRDYVMRSGAAGQFDASGAPSLKTGTPLDFLPVEQREMLFKGAIADVHSQLELSNLAQEQANISVQNALLAKASAHTLTSADILSSTLKPFGSGSKDEFLTMLRTGGNNPADDPAVQQDLFDRIHLPDGDPHKITDINALNQYFGHGIGKWETLNRLRDDILMRGTPEGAAESDLKKGMYDIARATLVKGSIMSGFSDPNDATGRADLQKFQVWFDNAYAAGRKKGLTSEQLLLPGNKDYLGGQNNANVLRFKTSDTARLAADTAAAMPPSAPIDTPAAAIARRDKALPNAKPQKATPAPLRRSPGESPEAFLKRAGMGP